MRISDWSSDVCSSDLCTQKNGRRWSTAKAFLEPARNRPNLRVETNAQATGLLFEGKRCVGVAYVQNGQPREARCGREVVLAAGAIQSPHILELSGIDRKSTRLNSSH